MTSSVKTMVLGLVIVIASVSCVFFLSSPSRVLRLSSLSTATASGSGNGLEAVPEESSPAPADRVTPEAGGAPISLSVEGTGEPTTAVAAVSEDSRASQFSQQQTQGDSSPRRKETTTSSWNVRNKLSRGRFAVFTIVKNEPVFLRMWLRHYVREFPREDIYVINNGGNDTIPSEFAGANMVRRVCSAYFDHTCINRIVEKFLRTLLQEGYEWVVFSESDELLYAPKGGMCKYLDRQNAKKEPHVRAMAFEVVHFPDDEPPLDWNEEPIHQRTIFYRLRYYDKSFINAHPAIFGPGFHHAKSAYARNPYNLKVGRIGFRDYDIVMVHMQKVDFDYFIQKGEWKAKQNHHAGDLHKGFGKFHTLSGSALNDVYWLPLSEKAAFFSEIPSTYKALAMEQWNRHVDLSYCLMKEG